MTTFILHTNSLWFALCVAALFARRALYVRRAKLLRVASTVTSNGGSLPPTPLQDFPSHKEPSKEEPTEEKEIKASSQPPPPTCSSPTPPSHVCFHTPDSRPKTWHISSPTRQARRLSRQISMPLLNVARKAIPSALVPAPLTRGSTFSSTVVRCTTTSALQELSESDWEADAEDSDIESGSESEGEGSQASASVRARSRQDPPGLVSRTDDRDETSDAPSPLPAPSITSVVPSRPARRHSERPLRPSILPMSKPLHTVLGSKHQGPPRSPRRSKDGNAAAREGVRMARPACPENSLPCEVFEHRFENPFRPRNRSRKGTRDDTSGTESDDQSATQKAKGGKLRHSMLVMLRLPFSSSPSLNKLGGTTGSNRGHPPSATRTSSSSTTLSTSTTDSATTSRAVTPPLGLATIPGTPKMDGLPCTVVDGMSVGSNSNTALSYEGAEGAEIVTATTGPTRTERTMLVAVAAAATRSRGASRRHMRSASASC